MLYTPYDGPPKIDGEAVAPRCLVAGENLAAAHGLGLVYQSLVSGSQDRRVHLLDLCQDTHQATMAQNPPLITPSRIPVLKAQPVTLQHVLR